MTELTPYGEIMAMLQGLPLLVHEARRQRQLSLRAAAEQAGCAVSTLQRLEAGDDVLLSNVLLVLRWLGKGS